MSKKLTEIQKLQNKISILECTIHETINVMVNTSGNFDMKEHDLRACMGVCIGNLFYGTIQANEEDE